MLGCGIDACEGFPIDDGWREKSVPCGFDLTVPDPGLWLNVVMHFFFLILDTCIIKGRLYQRLFVDWGRLSAGKFKFRILMFFITGHKT